MPTPKIVWRWDRNPSRAKPSRAWQLTQTEQGHVKNAVRLLRAHLGRKRFAESISISVKAARHATETKRKVSAGFALKWWEFNSSVTSILPAYPWKDMPKDFTVRAAVGYKIRSNVVLEIP